MSTGTHAHLFPNKLVDLVIQVTDPAGYRVNRVHKQQRVNRLHRVHGVQRVNRVQGDAHM